MDHRPRLTGADGGFVLAEVLVASLLGLLVVGAVFELYNPEGRAIGVRAEAVDMQQRARVAQDVLTRDLLAAGSGPNAGPGAGPLLDAFAPVLPRRLGRLGADPFDVARDDAVSLVNVLDGSWHGRLLEPFAGGPAPALDVAWGCGGSLAPCGHRGNVTVVAYDVAGAFDLFSLPTGPGISGSEALRPDAPSAYPVGMPVAAADLHVYYHDAERRQLRYYDGRLTDVPVIDDVVDVAFEYVGEPEPPARPRPPAGTANCLYAADGSRAGGLATLAASGTSLVPLPLELFRDGPWCGSGSNRYDADLLRIRQVRVRLRLQAADPGLRAAGTSAQGGTSRDARRTLPDYLIQFDVTPRNLNLSR